MEAITIMKEAWKDYKLNFPRLIIGTAIMSVAVSVLALFAFLPLLLATVFTGNTALFIVLSLFSLSTIIAIGVSGLFSHGYLHFISQAAGKHKQKSKDRMSFMIIANSAASGRWMAVLAYAFAAALFFMLAVPYLYTSSASSLIFAVPLAAVFLFFTALSPYVTAFENIPPLEAWGKSFELSVEHFWQLLELSVVMLIVIIVLAIIPIIGPAMLFLAVPWVLLSFFGFYKKC